MVTSSMSVRSSSGSRGFAAASAAAFCTASGNVADSFCCSWIAAMPARISCALTLSPLARTFTTRLLGMPPTLATRPIPTLARVLILLPPSEGKTAPRRGKALDLASLSSPVLTGTRTTLLRELVDLCRDDPDRAAEVLGLGAGQRDLVQRNAALASAPTARADAIYTGVLYDALGFDTLSAAARRRATARVAVTSSLFGIVRPGDRIPAYRLSGDATLPGTGSVAGAWREVLGVAVREAVGSGLLVDLRSGTYAAFWRPEPDLARRVATVRVLHESGGRRTGGEPLQQGDQGPDRPRAARGRRQPRHPEGARRDPGAPRLDRRDRRAHGQGHPARRRRVGGLTALCPP